MAKEVNWKAGEAKAREGWLKEHLPYEAKMMRYCLRRLNEMLRPWFLDWNAYLSGFAVAAGNITEFLTNGGQIQLSSA